MIIPPLNEGKQNEEPAVCKTVRVERDCRSDHHHLRSLVNNRNGKESRIQGTWVSLKYSRDHPTAARMVRVIARSFHENRARVNAIRERQSEVRNVFQTEVMYLNVICRQHELP